MSAIWPDTPRRACAARGYVIALGLYSAKISQEGFSSNLMGSSTALQLDKSLWPSCV